MLLAVAASKGPAYVGASDHCGWAILMTVAGDGTFIDRRRIELLDDGLPIFPHHHDGQGIPIDQAVALVERVNRSAEACAKASLETLAASVSMKIAAIAIRKNPSLPDTIAERITNYRAQTMADGVMFRNALAKAAEARGWSVHWYEAKHVMAEAASALGRKSIDALLDETGDALGTPWQKDHRQAMAAAIAASGDVRITPRKPPRSTAGAPRPSRSTRRRS